MAGCMRTALGLDDMLRRLLLAVLLSVIYSYTFGIEPAPQAQVAAADTPRQSEALQRLLGRGNPDELLPADEAFQMSVAVADHQTIVAEFVPANGYYLYRDKFAFRVQEPADVKVTSVELPRGELKDDPFFGKTEIFHNKVQALVRLQRSSARPLAMTLHVEYQGCNDPIGVCYPPIEKRVRLELPASTNVR